MLRHYRHSASGTRSAAAATTQPAAASGDAAAVSAEDYARAEAFTAEGVGGLVSSGGLMSFTGRGGIGIGASWLPDETLWYRDGDGAVVLVDPAAKTTAVCDDATCADLGIPAAASGGAAATAGASGGPPLTLSPDGLLGAFVQECNLWVRDIGTGIDRQLTFDGEKERKKHAASRQPPRHWPHKPQNEMPRWDHAIAKRVQAHLDHLDAITTADDLRSQEPIAGRPR